MAINFLRCEFGSQRIFPKEIDKKFCLFLFTVKIYNNSERSEREAKEYGR